MHGNSLLDWFKSCGVQTAAAEIRARFVEEVLEIYDQAAESLLDGTRWTEFEAKLGALGKPKKAAGSSIQYPIEDAITSEIGHLAKTLVSQLPADHFLKIQQANFVFEFPVHSATRAGRHSKKADFLVYTSNALRLEIAIEAKPIRTPRDISKDYLGDAGIGCFFDPDSAYTCGPLGAMWAYTSNPNAESQAKNIAQAISVYQPTPLRSSPVHDLAFAPAIATQHARANANLCEISIFHVEKVFPVRFSS